jgi:glycosyltransferase involved in cell wall biosynthesis
MNICLDGSAAVHGRAGLGRYTRELVTALRRINGNQRYSVFYNRSGQARHEPAFDGLPAHSIWMGDKPWRALVLLAHRVRLSQDRLLPDVDLFHATDHLLPYFSTLKSVFTLNDLTYRLFPQYHSRWNRLFLTWMMPVFLRRAGAVIAISKSTERDALRFYRLGSKKITVIYDGVSSHFSPHAGPGDPERLPGLPERYILYVGTIEPRKNLTTLLKAYRRLRRQGFPQRLVIAGKRGWLYEEFDRTVESLGLQSEVALLGRVPDAQLPALYRGADLFAYPSLYEGFGLPVLEAMACGAPVVCSKTSSLPELAGGAALLVDPRSPEALAETMGLCLADEELRLELRRRGLEKASRFTWERTARLTLAVYERVAAG